MSGKHKWEWITIPKAGHEQLTRELSQLRMVAHHAGRLLLIIDAGDTCTEHDALRQAADALHEALKTARASGD